MCCSWCPFVLDTLFPTPSHWVFMHITQICLALSFSRLNSSSSLSFSAYDRCLKPSVPCGPSLDPLQYARVSLELGSPALDTALQMCLTRAEQSGRIMSLNLLAMQPKKLFAFFAMRLHDWLVVNFSRTPKSFPAKLIPIQSFPSLSCCVC